MASKSYSEWKVLGVVALLVVVATTGYIIISDDEGYDWHLGKYQIYDISASNEDSTFDGTLKIEVVSVEGKILTMRSTFDIYENNKDGRVPYIVMEKLTTYDITENELTWMGSETLPTNWGTKIVDVYSDEEDEVYVLYTDQKNSELVYRVDIEMYSIVFTYILTDTNYHV